MSFDVGAVVATMVLDVGGWNSAVSKVINSDMAKLSRSADQLSEKFSTMANKMALWGTAISGAVYLAANQFIRANDAAEQFNLRLKVILGSQEEANRLFKTMADFAASSTFTFEEILGAAVDLSAAMKNGAADAEMLIPIIADIAATSGLSFQEVKSNMILAFSGGIAAADLFRQRGISAMLGFQGGVEYTAEQTRRQIVSMYESPMNKFRGASLELVKTWTGQVSMMKDRWFLFLTEILKSSGVFDQMKNALSNLNRVIESNWESIRRWVAENGNMVSNIALTTAALGAAGVALVGLGAAFKVAAFGLSAFAFAMSPVTATIIVLAGAFYALRAVVNETMRSIWEDEDRFGGSQASWVDQIVGIYRDGFMQIYRDYKGVFDLIGGTLKSMANFVIGTFVLVGRAIGTVLSTIWEAIKGMYDRLFEAIFIFKDNLTPEKILDDKAWAETGNKIGALFVDNFTFQLSNLKSGFKTLASDSYDAWATDYVGKIVEAAPIVWEELSKASYALLGDFGTALSNQWKRDLDSMLGYMKEKLPFIKDLMAGLGSAPAPPGGERDKRDSFSSPGAGALSAEDALRAGNIRTTAQVKEEIMANQALLASATQIGDPMAIKQITDELKKLNEELKAAAGGMKSLGDQMRTGLKSGFAQMKAQWTDVAGVMERGIVSVSSGLYNGISQGITDVIMQTRSWGDVIKDLGRSFISALVNMAVQLALTIPLMLIANVLSGGAIAATGAAVTSVAISQALGSMGAAMAQGPVAGTQGQLQFNSQMGDIQRSSPSAGYATGIESVPYTGYYKLHPGEEVVPRYDAAKREREGGASDRITIINLASEEDIARAMAGDAGGEVIINKVFTDQRSNGQTRRGR